MPIDTTAIDPQLASELTMQMEGMTAGFGCMEAAAVRTLAPGRESYLDEDGTGPRLNLDDGYNRIENMSDLAPAREMVGTFRTETVALGRKADAFDFGHANLAVLRGQGVDVDEYAIQRLAALYLSIGDYELGQAAGTAGNYLAGHQLTPGNIVTTPSTDIKGAMREAANLILDYGEAEPTHCVVDFAGVTALLGADQIQDVLRTGAYQGDNATDAMQLERALQTWVPGIKLVVLKRSYLTGGTRTPFLGDGVMALYASRPGIGSSFLNAYLPGYEVGSGMISSLRGNVRTVDAKGPTVRNPMYSVVGELYSKIQAASGGRSQACGVHFSGMGWAL